MTAILTDAERTAIRRLAAGDKAMLDDARAAFDRAAQVHGPHACVELQFMSEMLAPVPDLLLRAQYRAVVLKQDA
ncbi:hypothetical protein AB3X91_33700 [Paraburkholderia sp. BR14263]|uniref:hypothetical protein n=1 Tax=unclassified Paraburkholderia TaxID=2615204 RepID=UPI0034CFF83E